MHVMKSFRKADIMDAEQDIIIRIGIPDMELLAIRIFLKKLCQLRIFLCGKGNHIILEIQQPELLIDQLCDGIVIRKESSRNDKTSAHINYDIIYPVVID